MLKKNTTNRIVMLVVILCFAFTPAAVFASAAVPPVQGNYVALGDSLAAGVTPDGDGYGFCSSYADFLSGKVSAAGTYDNLGVPGLMAMDLLCLLHGEHDDFIMLHEHMMALSDDDLRMIIQELNGGVFSQELYNALKYGNEATYSYALSLIHEEIIAKLGAAEVVTLNIGANDVFNAFELNNLSTVFYEILECIDKESSAKVFFMNYYNPYTNELDPGHIAFDALNASIAGAIAAHNATADNDVVPVRIDALLDSVVNPEKYLAENEIHPTQFGYQLIAKEFWSVMRGK